MATTNSAWLKHFTIVPSMSMNFTFLKGVGDAKILGFSLKTESSGYVFAINTALFINIL